MLRWPWLRSSDVRCARCGVVAAADMSGVRVRYKVDADRWADRCAESGGLKSPFDCPHLRDALKAARRSR